MEYRAAKDTVDRDVQVSSYPLRWGHILWRGIIGVLHGMHRRPHDTAQHPQHQNDTGCFAA